MVGDQEASVDPRNPPHGGVLESVRRPFAVTREQNSAKPLDPSSHDRSGIAAESTSSVLQVIPVLAREVIASTDRNFTLGRGIIGCSVRRRCVE